MVTMTQIRRKQPGKVGEYITIEEAVAFSGYTEQYIRRLARKGRIGAVKFGHFWMVHRQSLKKYMRHAKREGNRDQRFGPRNMKEGGDASEKR